MSKPSSCEPVGSTSAIVMALLVPGIAWSMDCAAPTLMGATGVIGQEHRYKISGHCSHAWSKTETEIFSSTTTNYGLSFVYSGGAEWSRVTGIAIEKLKFTGDSAGSRYASAKCSQDPFLRDPPAGAASCGTVKVQLQVGSGKPYEVLLKPQFWARSGIALAEAQALSAQATPSQPPPPPPVEKPKPKVPVASADTVAPGGVASSTSAAAFPQLLEIEAESLAKANAVQVSGGQARVQSMSGFGSAWSGGEQLFWSDGTVGAVLDLLVDIPVGSKYAIEAYFTRAPDYGQMKIEVDGKPSPVTFDGMAPKVAQTGPTQLGNFPLPAGQRRISFMIVGKHPQSSGYYAGIDRIRLYPAGPLN